MTINIEEQIDKIDEDGIEVNWTYRVGRFKEWFINNIFGRSLSYLVGWTGNAAKLLLCTSTGILKVAVAGSIYENNESATGTSADAYATAITFTNPASKVEVWSYTNAVTITRSAVGVIWQDEILLEKGAYYSFEATTVAVQIKSTAAGVHSTYQIIGWN